MVEFTLTKAVTSYGEKVSKITLREPTGAEVRRFGSPLVFTPEGGMDFNMDRVGKYLEVLASPPLTPNSVNEIAACDWLSRDDARPFFHAIGGIDGIDVELIACELAEFWHTTPDYYLAKTVPDLIADYRMTGRYAEERKRRAG